MATTKQRTREELYDLFRQGAIPSGADFSDLITSQVNIKNDGIGISGNSDDPICFTAHGDQENFLDFADTGGNKKWRLSGYDEAIDTEGFNITADSQSKLFIQRETGNIGVGTDEPKAKVHIIQTGSTNILEIDDEGNDETPLVITSDGSVGIGTAEPSARLHLSYSGSGDILRVDDTSDDTTPLIIDDTGNIGIGYDIPQTKLAVNGGVAIGSNDKDPGSGNLYVAGNIEVAGTVVLSTSSKGIELDGPLTSNDTEVVIKDNVIIMKDSSQASSDGNLTVAGDTTLGTYNAVYENQSVLTINGRIESGGDAISGDQQYELEINQIFTVDRKKLLAKVTGDLTVTGNVTLGDSQSDAIYLNGLLSSTVGELTIDDDLKVNGSVILGDQQSDAIYLNGTISSSVGDVIINDSLIINESVTLGNSQSDAIYLNGTVSSGVGNIIIDDSLVVNDSVTLGSSLSDSIYLNGTISSTLGDVTINDNLTVTQRTSMNTAAIQSLQLSSGATISEISTDTALSGNSDSAVPTVRAVKKYIDNCMASIKTLYA
ncbi:MAG TPA: hypothetical protein DDW50_14800 [Firmicutes bacterium]|jgi:hypothetical protein|nr:hypothetical protein [Bacillota bacterium]